MMFAIVTLSAILVLDFLMWITSEKIQPFQESTLPPADYQEQEETKDFETTLKEYESDTETITWEVKNKQLDS